MSRQSEKEARLKGAMADLVSDPRFLEFVECLRDMKEGAVAYAVSHTTVRDQRESLAAMGEVRAYLDIISLVDAHREPVANQVVGDEPEPAG